MFEKKFNNYTFILNNIHSNHDILKIEDKKIVHNFIEKNYFIILKIFHFLLSQYVHLPNNKTVADKNKKNFSIFSGVLFF